MVTLVLEMMMMMMMISWFNKSLSTLQHKRVAALMAFVHSISYVRLITCYESIHV